MSGTFCAKHTKGEFLAKRSGHFFTALYRSLLTHRSPPFCTSLPILPPSARVLMPFPKPVGSATSFAVRATCLVIMLVVAPRRSVAAEPIVFSFAQRIG